MLEKIFNTKVKINSYKLIYKNRQNKRRQHWAYVRDILQTDSKRVDRNHFQGMVTINNIGISIQASGYYEKKIAAHYGRG